jgi:hypothetical protein
MADLLQKFLSLGPLDIGADDTRLYKLRDAATESIAEIQQTSASDWAIPCLDGVVREIPKEDFYAVCPERLRKQHCARGTCFHFASARGGLASDVFSHGW